MVHRINMLLNSSSDEDEMIISEITELKSVRPLMNVTSNNNSIINITNITNGSPTKEHQHQHQQQQQQLIKSPINISSSASSLYHAIDEEEDIDEILQSPKKLRSSNGAGIKVTSPITVSNIINHDSPTRMGKDYSDVLTTLKNLNTNYQISPSNNLVKPQAPLLQKTLSMGAMSQYLNRFEKSEQEVADKDYFDSDEDDEFDDDDDLSDEDGDYVFPSKFEEIIKANTQSCSGLPGSVSNAVPSSNQSTPNVSPKRVPTQDYKLKSESVKQNPDGTYSCPYPNCNKTIKGNKGNLSSHLRWHRRLDAEAGEARGVNPTDEGEEEFTTPTKPSQRGVQLRNQMIHYGLNLFRQDSQGKYLCFFEGCNLRMLTNFSRHIAKHERKCDRIKDELVPLLPPTYVHGSPATSPMKKSVALSMSSPSSPTASSSSRYQSTSQFSPNLSTSCSSIPLIIESSPLTSAVNATSLLNSSPAGESSRLKRKLQVNVKFNTPVHTSTPYSGTISQPCTPSIHSHPFSAPCTPTTTSSNSAINFSNQPNKFNILSPRSLSSPSFPLFEAGDFRKGKLESIISSDNDFTVPTSSPITKSTSSLSIKSANNSPSSGSLFSSPLSPTSGCVPNTPSRYQLPQVSLFKDIQWDYNRSPSKKSSNPTTSVGPMSPLSSSSSSIVPFTNLCSKPKSKEDDVVKSLIDLGHY